jgi:hypothetical protein
MTPAFLTVEAVRHFFESNGKSKLSNDDFQIDAHRTHHNLFYHHESLLDKEDRYNTAFLFLIFKLKLSRVMIPHDHMETVPLTPRDVAASDDDASALSSTTAGSRSTYLSFFRSPRNEPPRSQPQAQSTPLYMLPETFTYEQKARASFGVRQVYPTPGAAKYEENDSDDDDDSQTTAPWYLPAPQRPSQASSEKSRPFYHDNDHDDDCSSVFSSLSAAYSDRLEEHLSQISSQSHLFGEPLLMMEDEEEVEEEYLRDLERGRLSDPSCQSHSVASRRKETVREEHVANTTAAAYSRPSASSAASVLLNRVKATKIAPFVSSLTLPNISRPPQQLHSHYHSTTARSSMIMMSPRSKGLHDNLDYLLHRHKERVKELDVLPQDHFDFCLILQPQNVYGYWADLLDFRQEFLGVDAVSDMEEPWNKTKRIAEDNDTDENEKIGVPIVNSNDITTPSTASLRRRRGNTTELTVTPLGNSNSVNQTPEPYTFSSRRFSTNTGRKSVFEQAIGSPVGADVTRSSFASHQAADLTSNTLNTGTMDTPFRRRWGAGLVNNTPSAISPPIRSLTRGTSAVQLLASTVKPRASSIETNANDVDATSTHGKPRDPNELRLEDIPPQRFARGIAARTNGMLPFLSALKRGIVVRKHRPGQESVFCRLESNDGGDTVRFTIINDQDEAMTAFKEQRVRYNKLKYEGHDMEQIVGQAWSYGEHETTDENPFSVPNHVAAQKYRERMARERQGAVGKRVNKFAANVARVGHIRAADIAVVHPGVFNDPRSADGELGTSTLRRSKSKYNLDYTFSLVMRNERLLGRGQAVSIDESEGKWLSGEGSEAQFKYHDFETATIGEYWLIFRGFLLLHRDAAVGRFAARRAAGIGSHYNRLEMEQRAQAHDDDHNLLNQDAFSEPKTVGCLEKMIVQRRGLDTTYLEGYTQPGAVPPPSDYFLGFRSPGTAIWSRLRFAGMETCRIYSLDPNRVMIKIRCPSERMLDVAEVLRVKLKTKEGTFAPFREDMMDIYQSFDDVLETPPGSSTDQYPFRSSIRNSVIDFIVGSRIRDSGAELAQNTELGKMILARVPLHMRSKLDEIYHAWFYFWKPENWKGEYGWNNANQNEWKKRVTDIQKALTIDTGDDSDDDSEDEKGKLSQEPPSLFKRFFVGCFHQPLDDIEQYFGEKVAFYFAWLQHTASHLVFLSVAGLIMFFAQLSSGNWDHPARPLFSIIVMLWTFLVLINWKKRANLLAYQWGTLNYKQQEVTRPQFQGEYTRDEVTGEWVVTYPSWKRWLKYLISFPLTLLFTFGTLVLILWVHANRDLQLDNYYEQTMNTTNTDFKLEYTVSAIGKRGPVVDTKLTREMLRDPTFWFITVGMPSMLGLFLPLMNLILMRISIMLNDFENYRTESEYRTWLIIKVFSFRFVCYFATLYYYAFISVGSDQAIENGILRVGSGVLVYTTVAQWWQTFLHVCFPMFIKQLRMQHRNKRMEDELRAVDIEEEEVGRLIASGQFDEEVKQRQIRVVNKRLLLDQAQDDLWLEVMNPMHDSFPEYIQAVVQFTFCSCFSVVLPITPLICLINYLISMRLDAYKLCKCRRRPLAEKTGGIGIWEHLMHIVAVISVLTNCWLMGFTTATFTNIGEQIGQLGLFALVVGWEHVMLLIKYIMQNSMSPLPRAVRDAMKREQYELDQQRSLSMQTRRLQHQREHDANSKQDENTRPLLSSSDLKYSLQTIPSEDQDDDYLVPLYNVEGRASMLSSSSTQLSESQAEV